MGQLGQGKLSTSPCHAVVLCLLQLAVLWDAFVTKLFAPRRALSRKALAPIRYAWPSFFPVIITLFPFQGAQRQRRVYDSGQRRSLFPLPRPAAPSQPATDADHALAHQLLATSSKRRPGLHQQWFHQCGSLRASFVQPHSAGHAAASHAHATHQAHTASTSNDEDLVRMTHV